MFVMNISDLNLSEALYRFVTDNPCISADMMEKSRYEAFSMVEYVNKYKRDDFRIYASENFGIDVNFDN